MNDTFTNYAGINKTKSKTVSVSPTTRHMNLSPEELKEFIDKAKEYLKMNKNISCFYHLNRIWKSFLELEIEIHSRFKLYRIYTVCIQRLISKIFYKHPERNEKQNTKIFSLLTKGFCVLHEWHQYLIYYLSEYKGTSVLTKQNEKIYQEIMENVTPLLYSEREALFTLKVFEEFKFNENNANMNINSPEKIPKKEDMQASILKKSVNNLKGIYRKLSNEEKYKTIKFGFYFNEFIYIFLEFNLFFAIILKKKKNPIFSVQILKRTSETLKMLNPIKNAIIIDLYIRVHMFLAGIYWENGHLSDTLAIYDDLIEYLRKDFIFIQDQEFNYRKAQAFQDFKYRIQATVRRITLVFLMQGMLYEALEKYERSLECFKFGSWISNAFLEDKDEMLHYAVSYLSDNRKKYEGILKESGEIAKVLQISQGKLYHHPLIPDIIEIEQKPDPKEDMLNSSNILLYTKYKQKLEPFEYIYVKTKLDATDGSMTNSTLIKPNNSNFFKSNIIPKNNNRSHTYENKSHNSETKINNSQTIDNKTEKNPADINNSSDKTPGLFEVSIEPTYREQSQTSKRLSINQNKHSSFYINRFNEGQTITLDQSINYKDLGYKEKNLVINNSTTFQNSSKVIKRLELIKTGQKLKEEEFPANSSILTTLRYFKTSEEIRKLVEEKHKKCEIIQENSIPNQEMQNLDEFFAKKINSILLKKCQNRSMNEVQETFISYLRDEDFDKKEFDFSKKMLRHKKSYSMGKIKSEFLTDQEEKERLNFLHPRREVRGEIKDLLTKNTIKEKINRNRTAQEDEKTNNFSLRLCQRSSIMGTLDNGIRSDVSIPILNSNTVINGNNDNNQIIPKLDDNIGKNAKEKLQGLIMKHRVTFEFKEMVNEQNRLQIERNATAINQMKNSTRESNKMTRNSINKKSFSASNIRKDQETIDKMYENTKEILQRLAENVSKDLESCERQIDNMKKNVNLDERKKKRRKEKELNAKRGIIVKLNGDLSKSVKGVSMKREIFENFQNQIIIGQRNAGGRKKSVIHPIPIIGKSH